jgi:hypothetical protein
MKSPQFCCLVLVAGFGLMSAGTTIAGAIVQKRAPNGDVILTNVNENDEVYQPPAQPQGTPAAIPMTVAPAAAAPAAAVTANDLQASPSPAPLASKAPRTLAERYYETILNQPALPSGMPTNPAVQRRYLMIKKSDFVPGN